MRKILALLLVACTLLSVAACDTNPPETTGSVGTPTTTTTPGTTPSATTPAGTTPAPTTTAPVTEDNVTPTPPKAVTITEEDLYDKIIGGWIGQMVGVAWAASTEFQYAGKIMPASRMDQWKPDMINNAFGQDDLYVEIPFIDAMKENGFDCDPKYMAEKFRDSKFALWHANYMGRENLLNGIEFPESGSYMNNYHADDIDWQIEADFLGMMYPGMPNEAAKRAFEIGHIMNYGDGVYGGVFVTAMHSAAYTAESIDEIIEAGISVIPKGTQFRMLLEDVMASYEAGDTWQQNWQKLENKWAKTDLCPELPGVSNIDAKLNSGYILIGMLYGEGDFEKTILISTQCGQDSDCNPSSAASVLGNFYGAKGIKEIYKSGLKADSTKFSYTNYTFNDVADLNMSLAKDVIKAYGGKDNGDGTWTVMKDTYYAPVKFEQWPDGVYAYFDVESTMNTVKFVELTPYSKNEKVVKYVIDMGDGQTFTDVMPTSYAYAKAGTYTIKVTVYGDKGTQTTVERTVKTRTASTAAMLAKPTIICSVTRPAGGGSRDIGVICDGVIPNKATANDKMQYDTYILGDPHGNPEREAYIGYIYREEKTLTKVVFTEGNHFGNGGWFKNEIILEAFVDGKWVELDYTSSPAYPKGNSASTFGSGYDTYTLEFDSVKCTGIRLRGIAGGSAGFISVSELSVG
ncbi:MAG: hypothetical protein E7675_05990 [Ruminococcaceae bacterium]|nr:hypothetical protein [Oscillospiraceae bacterium]